MTLDEAIEILTQCASTYAKGSRSEILGAFKLGIEALKRVKKMRTYKPTPPGLPLPGETEE